jgi:hypothetical protein
MLDKHPFALMATALIGFGAQAQADTLYDWSFITTANVVDGSGTLTVDTSGLVTSSDGLYTGYLVTSFSGTYLGQAIGALLTPGVYYNDNLLLNLTGTAEQLDRDGISFTFGTSSTQENLWVPDSSDSQYKGAYGTGLSDLESENGNYGAFVAVPAPEPSTMALAGLSGATLLFLFRRRK